MTDTGNTADCGGECHNDCDKDQEDRSACDPDYGKSEFRDGPYPLPDWMTIHWMEYVEGHERRQELMELNASAWKIKSTVRRTARKLRKFWREVRGLYPEFNKHALEYEADINGLFVIKENN